MMKAVVFDIDGTMLDTREAILGTYAALLRELEPGARELPDLEFTLGIPTPAALERLGIADVVAAERRWLELYCGSFAQSNRLFDGIEEVVRGLRGRGLRLGIVTSKDRVEYAHDFVPLGLEEYFDVVVCVDDVERPKPDPEPMLKFLELSGMGAGETLYLGDTILDMACARGAGVKFALAGWGCHRPEGIEADLWLEDPREVLALI